MYFVGYLHIMVMVGYVSCIPRAVYLKTVFIQLPLAQLRHTQITVNSLLVIGKSRSDNEWTIIWRGSEFYISRCLYKFKKKI